MAEPNATGLSIRRTHERRRPPWPTRAVFGGAFILALVIATPSAVYLSDDAYAQNSPGRVYIRDYQDSRNDISLRHQHAWRLYDDYVNTLAEIESFQAQVEQARHDLDTYRAGGMGGAFALASEADLIQSMNHALDEIAHRRRRLERLREAWNHNRFNTHVGDLSLVGEILDIEYDDPSNPGARIRGTMNRIEYRLRILRGLWHDAPQTPQTSGDEPRVGAGACAAGADMSDCAQPAIIAGLSVLRYAQLASLASYLGVATSDEFYDCLCPGADGFFFRPGPSGPCLRIGVLGGESYSGFSSDAEQRANCVAAHAPDLVPAIVEALPPAVRPGPQ